MRYPDAAIIAEAVVLSSFLLDVPALDFVGLGLFLPSMEAAARAAYLEAFEEMAGAIQARNRLIRAETEPLRVILNWPTSLRD